MEPAGLRRRHHLGCCCGGQTATPCCWTAAHACGGAWTGAPPAANGPGVPAYGCGAAGEYHSTAAAGAAAASAAAAAASWAAISLQAAFASATSAEHAASPPHSRISAARAPDTDARFDADPASRLHIAPRSDSLICDSALPAAASDRCAAQSLERGYLGNGCLPPLATMCIITPSSHDHCPPRRTSLPNLRGNHEWPLEQWRLWAWSPRSQTSRA